MTSSGIPQEWAATSHRPGVNLLENASESTAKRIAREMIDLSKSGDAIVASIHWGGNWGYAIRQDELDFGRSLIDHGIHVVHGHSSHHVKTVEIHRGGLLLYGCGDFINDYEGIRGHEIYRPDLAIIYLVDINLPKNRISDLQMLPMKVRRFRLERASIEDAAWLTRLLKRLGSDSFTRVNLEDDYAIAASSNNS
jgi:poly-gamma-glutamate synthesis protein (capsule biosynthesis protein)